MISVCIPCYNVENYIIRCLDNLLSQTYTDIEIICVDDGSTDNTLKKLTDYRAKHNNNIKIIRHVRNHKLLMARKTAVLAASGKYVMFLDPDDLLEENALQILADIINDTNIDVLEFRGSSWDFQTTPAKLLNQSYSPSHNGSLSNENIFNVFITNKLGQMVWNKLYSRDLVIKVYSLLRLNELYMREDIYFCCVLFALAKSYLGVENNLYRYSINTGASRDKPIDLLRFEEDCKAGDIVYSLIEIYYENFNFDRNKFLVIKYKIDRWLKQINFYNLKRFTNSKEFNQALEILASKWINLDLIKEYIRTDNLNLIEICNYLVSSFSTVLSELIENVPSIIFNKYLRSMVCELCNIQSLNDAVNSKQIDLFTKTNISIFGSCVCRDVFNSNNNNNYNIIRYTNGVSPFSLYSTVPPILLNSDDLCPQRSNFEKRACCIDWNKNFGKFYSIGQEYASVLVIDLCDARMPIGKINSSQVFDFYFSYGSTFIDSYQHNRMNQRLNNIDFTTIDPLKISDSDWNKCIINYCNFIYNNLHPSKIVIIETMFAEQYIENATIKCFDNIDYIKKINTLYRKLYTYLEKHLTINYSVIELPKFLLADKNHRLGCHPVHYTSNIYQYILDQINKFLES